MRLRVDEVAYGPSIEISGHYDLLLGASSWDTRCVEMLKGRTALSAGRAIVVQYLNQGATGRAASHLTVLEEQAATVCGLPPDRLQIDSEDLLESWAAIRSALHTIYRSVGRPLKVLIDLTSLPRYLSLGLLGYGLTSGFVGELDYFYASARSYETLGGSFDRFTSGRWLPWPIVGLGRPTRARSRTHLVVSAGMEGAKTRKLVNALEPDRISVVFSSPGASTEVEEIVRSENERLIEAYLVPPDQVLNLPLSVPVALAALQGLRRPDLETDLTFPEVTSFLLSGSKPHALAMAIASVHEGYGDVLYPRPEEHRESSALELGNLSLTRVGWPWSAGPSRVEA